MSGISIPAEKEGEYRFDIWSGEKHTHALFYCSASVDILFDAQKSISLQQSSSIKKKAVH